MKFQLTETAFERLLEIEADSIENWGRTRARHYLAEIYGVFRTLAENPDLGKRRRKRSAPFRKYPAGEHFVIYDVIDDRVFIVTLLHQVQDIERIIEEAHDELSHEVAVLRARFGN